MFSFFRLRVLLILSQPPSCLRGEFLFLILHEWFIALTIIVILYCTCLCTDLAHLRLQEQQRQGPDVLRRSGDGCEPAASRAGRPRSSAAGRGVSSGGDGRRVLHASLATIQLQIGQTEAEEQRHKGGAGVRRRAQPAPCTSGPYRGLRLRDISVPLNLLDSCGGEKSVYFLEVSAAP